MTYSDLEDLGTAKSREHIFDSEGVVSLGTKLESQVSLGKVPSKDCA